MITTGLKKPPLHEDRTFKFMLGRRLGIFKYKEVIKKIQALRFVGIDELDIFIIVMRV